MSGELKQILTYALDDEYKAEASYAAVIDKFGPVRPFVNIVDAERRHIEAIEGQFRRFGWSIPSNNWVGKVEPPVSLAAACEKAVRAEVDNIALYDRLLPDIADSGVHQTLSNLQRASRESHLQPSGAASPAKHGDLKWRAAMILAPR